MTDGTPVGPAQRIVALDALRGLALFGVLAINLETEFRVSIFRQFLPRARETGLERQIDALLTIFVDAKAFVVFSFLFGVGLAIQHEHLARDPRRVLLLARRLAALLLFGLVHLLLIWNGDILTEYALAGLIVLPFLFAPSRLLIVGAAGFLLIYLAMPLLPLPIGLLPLPQLTDHVVQAEHIYRSGNIAAILAMSWSELGLLLPLHISVLPRTLGLFLLGAASWRFGVIRVWNKMQLLTVAMPALLSGLVLVLYTHARWYSGLSWLGPPGPTAFNASTLLMGIGYAALVLALFAGGASAFVSWAAPVGRMAFTNYILQSLIQAGIFYGLHLTGMLDLKTGAALVIAIYAVQLLISHLWLSRFRFGPLEWLWRAIMYGHFPAFRRSG